nr:MAG TPA: Capsid protein [Cressdnaviricota sp.]
MMKRKYKKYGLKYNKKPRGMQRIKKVKWPTRNIGGDRAYCKLRYVIGRDLGIATSTGFTTQGVIFNLGAGSSVNPQAVSINGNFGNTPGLQTMAALYQNYRIRGIKLKITYWQVSGPPVVLYTNAAANTSGFPTASISFPIVTPNISILPEQRWARYRVCSQTQNGGKPTVLKSYYSVNKVQGPDNVVKNDVDYIGQMQVATPYWGTTSATTPLKGPVCEYGIFTMNGANATTAVVGTAKIEVTVYTEFFGKRTQTE